MENEIGYVEIIRDLIGIVPIYCGLFIGATFLVFLSRGTLDWTRQKLKSGLTNISFIVFNSFVGGLFLLPLVLLGDFYTDLGFPVLAKEFWSKIPLPLTVFILLFTYDFCIYWTHRALHISKLWPLHAVHHSDTDMSFLTWSRAHPGETLIIATSQIIFLSWLGLSVSEILAAALFRNIHQSYVHSNIDWGHGPFRKVLTSPQLHRWHHVDHPEAYDKNFASIFPIFDIAFGTYYNPGSAVDMPTGFKDAPGHDLVKLICFPFFEWARMVKNHALLQKRDKADKSALGGVIEN